MISNLPPPTHLPSSAPLPSPISHLPSPTPSPSPSWSLIIRPKTGWPDLHLADLWRYRDLTMLFVWRDFVAQYKQSILGPLWYLIQPLLTTLMFTLIFGQVANLDLAQLTYSAAVTAGILFTGIILFNHVERTFMDTV